MRLDIFLPRLRKYKWGDADRPRTWPVRLARSVLPGSLFSDHAFARPGWLRHLLRKIGPTWSSSPFRRAIQAAAFALFLWLFFYVCWPYDATPARVWRGYVPVQFDVAARQAVVACSDAAANPITRGMTLHVVDESVTDEASRHAGIFTVSSVNGQELTLIPGDKTPPARLDELAFSPGPWSLHEQTPGGWPSHYADWLAAKERLPAESFLVIDPLVSLSTAIAARSWVWSLTCAAGILLVCVFVPRGFCGYLCPLGTTIDLFDWLVSRRTRRFRVHGSGPCGTYRTLRRLRALPDAMLCDQRQGEVVAGPIGDCRRSGRRQRGSVAARLLSRVARTRGEGTASAGAQHAGRRCRKR